MLTAQVMTASATNYDLSGACLGNVSSTSRTPATLMIPSIKSQPDRRADNYRAPTSCHDSGYVALAWNKVQPYTELMRLERPAGAAVLYFPCLFGTLFVASIATPIIAPQQVFRVNTVFAFGSILVRSLGCTWNDYVDRDLDKLVERTKTRPLPRGSVTPGQTLLFLGAQMIFGIGVVLAFQPLTCLIAGAPSMIFIAVYPFAKKHTSYPQLVLGIPASWGIFMAFPALEMSGDKISTSSSRAAACLIAVCVSWTVIYDTIYAAQDVKDDIKAGVHSTMTRHQNQARAFLRVLVGCQMLAMLGFQYFFQGGIAFIVLTCFGSVIAVGAMVERVKLNDVRSCAWWFKRGNMLVALVMASGFIAEFTLRWRGR